MAAFEMVFGVPMGHSLRLVRRIQRRAGSADWEQEHEEYDRHGRLVAICENWSCGAASPAGREGGASGRGGYVKYAPDGRVLRRCDAGPGWPDTMIGPKAA